MPDALKPITEAASGVALYGLSHIFRCVKLPQVARALDAAAGAEFA
jgi:hypothetical protein